MIHSTPAPIRVLLFADNLDQGGTQTQLVQLANGLSRDPRFEVHVGCIHARGPLLADLRLPAERLREYPLHRFYSPGGLRQIARLARDIRRSGFHVVHAFDFYANVLCAAACAWLPAVRLVVSRRYERHSNELRHRAGERLAYALADAVVFNARGIADRLVARGAVAAAKIAVIPNGIDATRFQDDRAPAGPAGRDRRGPRIGVVARLHPAKGLDTLLDAAALLVERWPALELLLVGDGEQRAALEAQAARLGLRAHLTITGMQRDVRPWIARFDVAVLPSRREGFPNALLEYLASGRAVVATRVGGIPEIVRDGIDGVLVEPGDARGLAAALDALLRDEPRRLQLGRSASIRAREFGPDRAFDATSALYGRLVAGAAVAPGVAAEPRPHGRAVSTPRA